MKNPLKYSFSVKDIKDSKYMKTFKQFTNSSAFTSFFAKTVATIVIWIGVLIPTWAYLIIRWIADPVGFWQEVTVLLICMVVMGWLQLILAIGGFMLTIALILDDTI